MPRLRFAFLKSILAAALTTLTLLGAGAAQAVSQGLSSAIYIRSFDDLFISYFTSRLRRRIQQESQMQVEVIDAGGSREVQLSQVATSTAAILVVDTVNPADAAKMVEDIRARHATIVFFNQPPAREVIESYERAWYIGSHSVMAGKLQAELVLDYLKNHQYDRNGNHTLDIMLLRGPEGHQDAENRSSEVLRAFDDQGIKYQLIIDKRCQWSFDMARDLMKEFITAGRFNELDMIISNNDDMALGAINAIETSDDFKADRIDYLPAFGVDAVPEALNAIKYGSMTATVRQDFAKMADVAYSICTGIVNLPDLARQHHMEITDRFILVPYTKVSSSTLSP